MEKLETAQPLTLAEFLAKDKNGIPRFNNFFLFFVYKEERTHWYTNQKRRAEWFQRFYAVYKKDIDQFTGYASAVYLEIRNSGTGMMSTMSTREDLYIPLYELYLKAREFASDEELFV